MLYAVLVVALVALDQLVKYLVVQNIPLGEYVPFLPHILDLTYVQNTGAAFSLFSEHTWLLTLISLVMSVLLLMALVRGFFRHPFGRISLALLLAGAVGNLIDRAFQGYVVDMFHVLFMEFAVFNVADICVVVGGIAAAVYYVWGYERLEKGLHPPGAPLMTALTFTVQQSGERLDALLARSVEGLTRSAAQRLLEDEAVTCRGKALKKE